MMRPDELRLKVNAMATFEQVVETYDRMRAINSVDLYYTGHNSTRHGSITDGDEVSRLVRQTLVNHWWDKVLLEASNLRTHGVDPTSLMPKGSK